MIFFNQVSGDTLEIEINNIAKPGILHLGVYDSKKVFEFDRGDKPGPQPGIVAGIVKKVSKGVFKFNEIYNVADLETISTNNLILEISRLQNRNIYNFKIHKNLIHFIFKILGKEKDFYRIYNSLEIDISKVMSDYEWEPKYSINEGLKQTLIDC